MPCGVDHDWSGLSPLDVLGRWPTDRRILMLHSGRFDAIWSRYTIVAEASEMVRMDGEDQPFAKLRQLLSNPQVMWIGYLGYDLARWIEKLPTQAAIDRRWPIAMLGRCPGWAVYDQQLQQWSGQGTWTDQPAVQLDRKPAHLDSFTAETLKPNRCRADYESRVQRVLDYIAAGDVFQVNLSQRFSARFTGHPRTLYHRLAQQSPPWYGAYLELDDQHTIVSVSPELFLDVASDRTVITRPIKGTRSSDIPASVLRDSEKDTAELNMIVDLLRNDLGRVCDYASVQVTQPRHIETHPTVHHGVATVVGKLHRNKTLVDLLRAAMPGGSVTGAPKVRAMQIIEQLEPVRRGPYCGAIGLLQGETARLNIAIRTLMIEDNRIDLHVGGGIVADSDPADEYEETQVKAEAMLRALTPATPAPLPSY